MKTSLLLIAVSAGAALGQPSSFIKRNGVCPDVLYSVAQCCSANVLDVASLDCKTPSSTDATCSSGRLQCCSVPAAQQGVLCIDPVGA